MDLRKLREERLKEINQQMAVEIHLESGEVLYHVMGRGTVNRLIDLWKHREEGLTLKLNKGDSTERVPACDIVKVVTYEVPPE